MNENQQPKKLKFNLSEVRNVFRRKFQHEFVLPSGKYSGRYSYEITPEEVVALTAEFEAPTFVKTTDQKVLFGGYLLNESEWRLWLALRLKYGVNYMKPAHRQFWLDEYKYGVEPEPEPERDVFEEFGGHLDDLDNRLYVIEKTEEKKFNFDLTSEKTIL